MKRWRAVFYVILTCGVLLIVAGRLKDNAYNVPIEMQETNESYSSASTELSNFLLKEGWKLKRAGRWKAAVWSAGLAAFHGNVDGAAALSATLEEQRLSFDHVHSETVAVRDTENRKNKDESPFLDVKEHVREGRMAQARLDLMEIKESGHEADRAHELIKDMNKIEKNATSEPDRDAASHALYEEGLRLRDKGDIDGAFSALAKARNAISDIFPRPTFASALDEAHRAIMERIYNEIAPRLSSIAALIDAVASHDAHLAASEIAAVRLEIESMSLRLPGNNVIEKIKKKADTALLHASERWIRGAEATERFHGCKAALSVYETIANNLITSMPSIANEAKSGVVRCSRGH